MEKCIGKKRIALFVGKLSGGGAERVVSRLSICLQDYYDIYVLIYDTRKMDYEHGGTLIDLGKNAKAFPIMFVRTIREINSFVRDNNIELVISLCDFPNIVNGIINHSSKSIVSIRAHYEKGKLHTFMDAVKYPILCRSFKNASAIWTLTQYQKEVIIRDLHIKSDSIYVIGNPIDIESTQKKSKESNLNGINCDFIDEYTSVAVGRLCNQKNYEELLRIFEKTQKKCPQAKLLILGDGKLKDQLVNFSKRLNVFSKVRFAGRVDNPFQYISRCCLYISMSLYEGFPNSLVEAMSLGLPVIHSDCPTGPREILIGKKSNLPSVINSVIECEYGVLTPIPGIADKESNDAVRSRIADAWAEIIIDESYRTKLRKCAMEGIKRFEISQIVNNYLSMIEHVCER